MERVDPNSIPISEIDDEINRVIELQPSQLLVRALGVLSVLSSAHLVYFNSGQGGIEACFLDSKSFPGGSILWEFPAIGSETQTVPTVDENTIVTREESNEEPSSKKDPLRISPVTSKNGDVKGEEETSESPMDQEFKTKESTSSKKSTSTKFTNTADISPPHTYDGSSECASVATPILQPESPFISSETLLNKFQCALLDAAIKPPEPIPKELFIGAPDCLNIDLVSGPGLVKQVFSNWHGLVTTQNKNMIYRANFYIQ